MIEVVTRRYLRTLNEEFKKPDLILMDGGEIQVNATNPIDNMSNDASKLGAALNFVI